MIFFLFKPLNIKEQNFTDIPLFELETFILYELNTQGLATLMIGTEGIRYANRYQIKDIDYTDNSKQYIANMKAKHGIYKDEIVHLNGDVVYSREDGLVFTTQEIEYNKKTSVAHTDKAYVAYKGENIVRGESLDYNNLLNRSNSTNVVANYKIMEK